MYGAGKKRDTFIVIGVIVFESIIVCLSGCTKNNSEKMNYNENKNNVQQSSTKDKLKAQSKKEITKENIKENTEEPTIEPMKERKDIVILYTNDIHQAVDENIGLAGLMAYKKNISREDVFVTTVDVGDSIFGAMEPNKLEGNDIIKLFNKVGYDLLVIGNHEFDKGLSTLKECIYNANGTYLSCNITYSGNKQNMLLQVPPYKIIEYGDVKVGYIGMTTPRTLLLAEDKYLSEGGKRVYGFTGIPDSNDNGNEFYKLVQKYIDECKEKGADYIVALAHLGNKEGHHPFSSIRLAENTKGINIILDAHAHNEIECMVKKDLTGNKVLISSTGEKMNNIGKAVINKDGKMSTELIKDYDKKDKNIEAYIEELKKN